MSGYFIETYCFDHNAHNVSLEACFIISSVVVICVGLMMYR